MMTSPSTQTGVDRDVAALRKANVEPAPGLSIGQIFQMLLKHIWFILGAMVVCALIAFIYVRFATPIFEADATIRIDQERASSLGLSDLVSGGAAPSTDLVPTEIEILQSDRVAIATLDSLPDPVFKQYSGFDKQELFIPPGKEKLTADQEDLIGGFKEQLAAKQVGQTQLVEISFSDPNPQLAATIVNHLVTTYLRENFESRHESVSQITTWLSSQLQDLRTRAADAQNKLAQFEEKNGILAVDNSGSNSGLTTTTDRLRLLNDRLAVAEADRIVKEAQYREVVAGNQDPQVLAALFPNTKLQALQANQVTLYTQYAQLSAKFGQNYTPLAQLKKQMQDISSEISKQTELIRSQVKQEFEAAKQTEDMLRSEYQDQTQKAYALNREQADLATLQAEVSASRQLYNTLELKLQQAGIDAGLSGVNTIPVDSARAPLYPVAPKKKVILSLGAALGLLIGVVSALIIEASGDKVMSFEQVRTAVRYPSLVLIEKGPKSSTKAVDTRSAPQTIVLTEPLSRPAEAYRWLRNLVIQPRDAPNRKVFLIASAQSGEGKSTVATNFAIVLAQTGAKILLVDAELRRPTIGDALSVPQGPGLTDLLESSNGVTYAAPLPNLPNLNVLTAGKHIQLPAEALASTKMQSLLDRWREQFDFVVINSAPLLSVSDSLPLANWADAVLLVVRQGVTRLKHLQQVQNLLDQTDARVIGMIMTDARSGSELYGHERAYGKEAHAS